jgi:hypothetical protein
MFEVCPNCKWENDLSLETSDNQIMLVGFELGEPQKELWSSLNNSSPILWKRK